MSASIMTIVNSVTTLISYFLDYQATQSNAKYEHETQKEYYKTQRIGIYANLTLESLQILLSITNACKEYYLIVEEEKTKRKELNILEKEAITTIEAKKALLMTYLNRSFNEREQILSFLLEKINFALETGDNQQLEMFLSSVIGLAKINPLIPLTNYTSFQQKLNDPNYEWNF